MYTYDLKVCTKRSYVYQVRSNNYNEYINTKQTRYLFLYDLCSITLHLFAMSTRNFNSSDCEEIWTVIK